MSKFSEDFDMFLEERRARNSKLLLLRSIDSSLVNVSMASRLSDDLDTRSVDFEIGFNSLRTTGFDSSYSISMSKPSVDLENQLEVTSKLSGDFDSRFEDLLRGNFASSSSKISVPFCNRIDGFLATGRGASGCSSFVSTLVPDALIASKLSGDSEATLGGFLGSLASSSSKMSEFRDSLLEDFRATDTVFGSVVGVVVVVGDDALLLTLMFIGCGSRLSNESSAIVVIVDEEVFVACGAVRRGGLRFFGRTEIRW